MNDLPPETPAPEAAVHLDGLLRESLPEIKLALGEWIDGENSRPLPVRYAKLLPETLLVVTLRPDAAEVLRPVARRIEQELTDSCLRHGSLYDRGYRVQLHRSEDPDAPLFAISAQAGQEAEPEPQPTHTAPPAPAEADNRTELAEPAALPVTDPDATRLDGFAPAGWDPAGWVLVVADADNAEQQAFRLSNPLTVVGRQADDPQLQPTVALSDAPHISRRQLALVWEPRDGAPGFQVFNLGLNALHLPSVHLPGARVGRDALRLNELDAQHRAWIAPGMPIRIGEQGPTLRIEEVAAAPDDPDATVFE